MSARNTSSSSPILPRASASIIGAAPSAMHPGELAHNPVDNTLFLGKDDGTGVLIASPAVLSPAVGRAPRPTDDGTRGYPVGAFWNANGVLYRSLQSTQGQAVWRRYGATPLPLDSVTGAAAAYGTHLLRTAYTGKAINVVRASDSAALDIGFRSDGSLDTAALDAFVAGSADWRVAIWYDQSGNGNDATQTTAANRPTIRQTNMSGNSRSIVFDTTVLSLPQTQQSLVIPATVTSNQNNSTLVAIGRQITNHTTTFVEWTSPHPFVLGAAMDYTTFGTNPGVFMLYFNAIGIPGIQAQLTAGVEMAVSAPTNQTLWYNDFSSTRSGAVTNQTTAGGAIGARVGGANSGYNEVSAILMYPAALTDTQSAALRASLYATFGIAPQARDRLIFDGDSISQGLDMSYLLNYPRKTVDLLGLPVMSSNNGFTGETLVECITDYPTQIAPTFDPTARNNILLIFAGTNDIAGGADAATTYASLTSYVALAHATGFKVIVGTMLPRNTFTTQQQAIWTQYVALVRAGLAGADGLADFQADPTMGPQAAAANAALYGDGIHPTDLGYDYLAQIAANAISHLMQ